MVKDIKLDIHFRIPSSHSVLKKHHVVRRRGIPMACTTLLGSPSQHARRRLEGGDVGNGAYEEECDDPGWHDCVEGDTSADGQHQIRSKHHQHLVVNQRPVDARVWVPSIHIELKGKERRGFAASCH